VALLLAGGAGTLWWAAAHRGVTGTATSSLGARTEVPESRWAPVVVEPCSTVDIARERAEGTERCQRTRDTPSPQNWVEAPPAGFPAKSNPGGPFPGDACGNAGDQEYSPVGDHLLCRDDTWQAVA
jgi:serine/threonine-protein kinase